MTERLETRSEFNKRKKEEGRRKHKKLMVVLACVFVMIAGVFCGTVIASTINTPHDTVEIASANAQYVTGTVKDRLSDFMGNLPWNQQAVTTGSAIDAEENSDIENSKPQDDKQKDASEHDESEYEELPASAESTTGSAISGDIPATDNPYGIDPSKPMIALTFDDGPSQYTWSIVNTLQQHGARATFFLVGNRVASHEAAIDYTLANNNEIASHSYGHKNLTKLSDEDALAQIQQVDNAMQQQHAYTPKLFRVPYGERNTQVLQLLRSEGKPVIGWSVDPRDWEVQDKDKIVNHILSRVKDGDIVLMHDLYKPTADAVAELVPALQEQGYQLVTVSELFQYKGLELTPGTYYYSSYK